MLDATILLFSSAAIRHLRFVAGGYEFNNRLDCLLSAKVTFIRKFRGRLCLRRVARRISRTVFSTLSWSLFVIIVSLSGKR